MLSEQVPAEEATLVRRCLVALVSAVCRAPAAVLAVSLGLAALSLYAAATRLQYHTQRSDLISPRKESQQRWKNYLAEFGDDDDMVVVVQGTERPHMERALEALAGRVREQPDLFDRLFYKVDLRHLRNRALLFLPLEEIRSIYQNLGGMGPLLDFGPIGWRCLCLQSLLREANQRAARLTPGQPLNPVDEQFLTQLLGISRAARDMVADPARYKNPWSSLLARPPEQKDLLAEPQYFFSGDGTLAFLLVRPVKEKGSFTAAVKSVSALRAILARTRPEFPGVDFGLTGLPVLETDEMTAAQADTRTASWLAIAAVGLLFLVVYRGLAYPLLTLVTLLVGTAWAFGWLTCTVGHLNILSATFAVMLIGMGDYGVLWVMRYEQARREGMDVRGALLHTTAHVAVGNLTAATTLALAFFAAMFADFQAVAELGWIAGCGVLLCALACFTVLPALLMLFDRRAVLKPLGLFDPTRPGPRSWLPGLARRPGWVLAAGLGLALTLGAGAFLVRYDHNLLHLQARDLDSVRWELTLIEHTAGASWYALSYTATPEEALALKARYEELPNVSRVVEVASLVPREQEAKMDLLRAIRLRLHNLPPRGEVIPHARPSARAVQDELTPLIARLPVPTSATPGPALLADLRGALTALEDRLGSLADRQGVEERLREFDERLAGDLAEDLHRLGEVATPEAITLDDLPPDLRVRYLGRSGQWLVRVFAREEPGKSLWDFEPLEQFTRQIHTVDPQATGKPFGTVEGLIAMKDGLERAGLYALGVIVVVLLLDFRNLRNTLIALTPLALGLILALGVMGLCGLPLNPANMIAFPLILGVGIDNGVHVLHDYLLRRAEGRATISYAIGRGVLVKALTTMIGFGTLMVSTERGLAGLGLVLTLGVGCCMLTALVFLPAVLHLDARREEAAAGEEAVVPEPEQLVA